MNSRSVSIETNYQRVHSDEGSYDAVWGEAIHVCCVENGVRYWWMSNDREAIEHHICEGETKW